MSKEQEPASRTGAGPISAYFRYNLAVEVINSSSWDHLLSKIDSSSRTSDSEMLFSWLKLLSLTLLAQHTIAELLGLMHTSSELSDAGKMSSRIIDRMKDRWNLKNKNEVEVFLEQQTCNDLGRRYTPRVLFYLMLCTFAEIINILDKYTAEFENKELIICKLKNLNEARNTLVHKLFLGQVDAEKEINAGIDAGQQAWQMLQEIREKYDRRSPR